MILNSYVEQVITMNTLEYLLVYNHDTIQLYRTGNDNVVHTRMTTLAFILSELFPLDYFNTISCPPHNLKTFLYIIMLLHSYVEQVLMMCRVQE